LLRWLLSCPLGHSSLHRRPPAAEIGDISAAHAQLNIKAGNIRITFSDGHTDVVEKNGNCIDPHVFGKGDVGWTQCTEFNLKGYAMNQKLVVRLSDGRTKEFAPIPKAPFITGWKFVDNDSCVLIRSMSFHGPASYIRYDLAAGKMTNRLDGRSDADPVPAWARRLADERSYENVLFDC
jgi:hypothetical protein